jgi:hypothetical protein
MEMREILKAFWPLFALYFTLVVWSLRDLAKRADSRYLPKWAWALVILFVSTFGPILYLTLGRDGNGN